jgi:hypothetical protein
LCARKLVLMLDFTNTIIHLQDRSLFYSSPRQGHGGLTPIPLQHREPFLDRNE